MNKLYALNALLPDNIFVDDPNLYSEVLSDDLRNITDIGGAFDLDEILNSLDNNPQTEILTDGSDLQEIERDYPNASIDNIGSDEYIVLIDLSEPPDTDWLDDDMREPNKSIKADQSEVDAAVMDISKSWDNMAELADVVNKSIEQYEDIVMLMIEKISDLNRSKEADSLLSDELNGVQQMKHRVNNLLWTKEETLKLKEKFLDAFEAGVKNV